MKLTLISRLEVVTLDPYGVVRLNKRRCAKNRTGGHRCRSLGADLLPVFVSNVVRKKNDEAGVLSVLLKVIYCSRKRHYSTRVGRDDPYQSSKKHT